MRSRGTVWHRHRQRLGVQLVELSLRRSSTGLYWNGTSFGATTETFRPATRSGSAWSFSFPAASFPDRRLLRRRSPGVGRAGNVTTGCAANVHARHRPAEHDDHVDSPRGFLFRFGNFLFHGD